MSEAPQVSGTAAPVPEPEAIGVSLFTVVVLLFGFQFTGLTPSTSAYGFLPADLMIGIGMMIAGAVGLRIGSHVIGLFFSTFGPFVVSFALLSIGLVHKWWGIDPTQTFRIIGGFLMAWTIVLTLWLVLSVVLPLFFTLLLIVLDVGLWFLVVFYYQTKTGALDAVAHTAGWCFLIASIAGMYFVAAYWLRWAGFDKLSLGNPLAVAR